MSDTNHTTSQPDQKRQRKVWPWAITAMVALLAALMLPARIPQKNKADLLEQIEAAGGYYTLDKSGRPETGPSLPGRGAKADDMEFAERFDRVEDLSLPLVDSELFCDSVVAFKSLELLKFDLANSADFNPETAARMTRLEWLEVTADREVKTPDYDFLAGCQSVERLVLTGGFHDDGFWKYLPDMKSLTSLEVTYGAQVRGDDIPDLSRSKLESITLSFDAGKRKFHNFELLLTAPRLRVLIVKKMVVDDSASGRFDSAPALEVLYLESANVTDRILPAVSRCQSLRVLNLSFNRITGESLDLLAPLPLEALYLRADPLTQDACRNLSEFATLQKLSLGSPGLQPAWLAAWVDSPLASNLSELSLSRTAAEDADVIVEVLMSFPKLAFLDINRNHISDDALLKLADHPSLKRLNVKGIMSAELVELFRERVNEQGKTFPEIH